MAGYSNAIYHTEQQKSLKSYSKNAIGVKKSFQKESRFAHVGNEIKICSQNKCHHHLSNVCENSFRMFHSDWVISDYHSFVWQFEFPWLNLTNCPNKWMVIRNDPVPVKHTKWIFTDVGKVMMAFILATDFDFIAYMSKMAFFGSFFHANGIFGIWSYSHSNTESVLERAHVCARVLSDNTVDRYSTLKSLIALVHNIVAIYQCVVGLRSSWREDFSLRGFVTLRQCRLLQTQPGAGDWTECQDTAWSSTDCKGRRGGYYQDGKGFNLVSCFFHPKV